MMPNHRHQTTSRGVGSHAAEPAIGFRCPGCRRQVGALLQLRQAVRAVLPTAWICQGCIEHARRRESYQRRPCTGKALNGLGGASPLRAVSPDSLVPVIWVLR